MTWFLVAYLVGYCITVPKVYRAVIAYDGSDEPPMLAMVMALIFSMFWPVLAIAAVLTRVVRKDVTS